MRLHLEHDRKADAVYVRIKAAGERINRTKELDENRILDYAVDGSVIGIEFLNVSNGVDLSDLPHRAELMKLLSKHEIQQFA
jgi:uncharacterized protein YuzE